MPPGGSASYAEGHNEGMQRAMGTVLGGEFPDQKGSARTRRRWQPCLCGWEVYVCVLHNERPTQPIWASRADALPMISERLPVVATSIVTALENQDGRGCLDELSEAARRVGPRRIRFQTRLAGTERRCTPTPLWQTQSQARGNTVGSTMRLPVPNTSFGRPWCCELHVPPAKRICGLTLSLVRAPRSQSSSCSLTSSVPSCSRGGASL